MSGLALYEILSVKYAPLCKELAKMNICLKNFLKIEKLPSIKVEVITHRSS